MKRGGAPHSHNQNVRSAQNKQEPPHTHRGPTPPGEEPPPPSTSSSRENKTQLTGLTIKEKQTISHNINDLKNNQLIYKENE